MFLEIKNILKSQGTIDAISNFLNKIPKYTSHYSFSNRVYFHLTLSWKKLYEEFCKQTTDLQVTYKLFKSEADKYNVKYLAISQKRTLAHIAINVTQNSRGLYHQKRELHYCKNQTTTKGEMNLLANVLKQMKRCSRMRTATSCDSLSI